MSSDKIGKIMLPKIKLPKIKGHARIELTDVKTGKKEVIEHDNLVTNAVENYISRWAWLLGSYNVYSGTNTSPTKDFFFPLWQKMFGGLRLYDTELTESVNNVEYPSIAEAQLTGYAAAGIYSDGRDTMRGDYNQNESESLVNGYKFVFDFPTDRANGEIACLCLTSQLGGFHGNKISLYGSMAGNANITTDESQGSYRGMGANMSPSEPRPLFVCHMGQISAACTIKMYWDSDGNLCTINCLRTAQNELTFYRRVWPFSKVGIDGYTYPDGAKNIELATVDISGIIGFTSFNTLNRNTPVFWDGEDGYYYGNVGKYDGNGTNKLLKISATDYTVQVLATSSSNDAVFNTNYVQNNNSTGSHGYLSSRWVVYGNYFYILYSSKLYKVNKSSFEKEEIGSYSVFNIYKIGNQIVVGGRYLLNTNTDELVDTKLTWSLYGDEYGGAILHIEDVVAEFSGGSILRNGSSRWEPVVIPYPFKLATINNLDTPVTKTAAKTMKITYTLTYAE